MVLSIERLQSSEFPTDENSVIVGLPREVAFNKLHFPIIWKSFAVFAMEFSHYLVAYHNTFAISHLLEDQSKRSRQPRWSLKKNQTQRESFIVLLASITWNEHATNSYVQ